MPEGADVTITVSHPTYVRNRPLVVEDASEQEITVNVAQRGSVDLVVSDEDGPLADASVILSKDNQEIVRETTDSDGSVETGIIERGEYSITVLKSGYFTHRGPLSVTGDINRQVDLERGSVTVQFSVRDDHFDPARPVQDARVTVGGSTVTTLGNGEATLQIPVNTRVSAEVTKEGYDGQTVEFNVAERARTVDATIQRTPSVTIESAQSRIVVGESVRLEVTDEYGDPVSGATITVDGSAVGETNDQGVLVATIESAGEQELVASIDSLQSEPLVVEGIEASQQTTTTEAPTTTATTTEPTTVADDETTTNVGLPGFTAITAVLALVVVAFLARRRLR
ncbi:PGF-CTERM sorting domain-containing protein [Haladaptatus sp. GCM10025893]|uniref:PGF-CTERM sorting domain-containing protein n=1 Tax=Haladaptatus sp. GCM10025893 TaxID=3252659 RepID=UPI0036085423